MDDESQARDEPEQPAPSEPDGLGLGGFAAGVVVGAALGIGLGLLWAPERGDATRRRLRKRLATLRDGAEDQLNRAGKRIRRERRRRRLERALERLRDRVR